MRLSFIGISINKHTLTKSLVRLPSKPSILLICQQLTQMQLAFLRYQYTTIICTKAYAIERQQSPTKINKSCYSSQSH